MVRRGANSPSHEPGPASQKTWKAPPMKMLLIVAALVFSTALVIPTVSLAIPIA